MKTFKSTIVLLGTLLFFSACVEKPHDHHDDDDGLPNMDVVDEPEIIISVNDADRLFKNYGAERAKVLEEIVNSSNDLETPYIATRFVTVDYADLKQYVAFIDQESKRAGVKPEGLRFYFAKEDAPTNNGKISAADGKETIFVNPVLSFDGVNGQIAYAIQTDAAGNSTAVTVGSVIDSTKTPRPKGANLLLQTTGIQSLASDTFGYPPPPIPGDPNDYH